MGMEVISPSCPTTAGVHCDASPRSHKAMLGGDMGHETVSGLALAMGPYALVGKYMGGKGKMCKLVCFVSLPHLAMAALVPYKGQVGESREHCCASPRGHCITWCTSQGEGEGLSTHAWSTQVHVVEKQRR